MSRIRVAYTAGAAIGPDLFRFYRSIGINLKQLYGSTETCAYVCLQPDGGVQVRHRRHRRARRRDQDRRTAAKCWCAGRCCSKEYYKRPDATAEIDRRRRLFPHRRRRRYRRRRASEDHRSRQGRRQSSRAARCSRRTTSRTSSSSFRTSRKPWRSATERDTRLRVHQHRHGLGRQLGRAARHRLLRLYRSRAKPEVYELDQRVRRDGQRRARAAKRSLADSQVHRFLILHKELDPDDDELTRTRKVRRGFVAEKYAVLIDALYGGKTVAAHRDAGRSSRTDAAAWSPPICASTTRRRPIAARCRPPERHASWRPGARPRSATRS